MYNPHRINRDQLRAKSEITVQLLNAKRKLTIEQYTDLLETVAGYCHQELQEVLGQGDSAKEAHDDAPPW
jgi:hypothetical protein